MDSNAFATVSLLFRILVDVIRRNTTISTRFRMLACYYIIGWRHGHLSETLCENQAASLIHNIHPMTVKIIFYASMKLRSRRDERGRVAVIQFRSTGEFERSFQSFIGASFQNHDGDREIQVQTSPVFQCRIGGRWIHMPLQRGERSQGLREGYGCGSGRSSRRIGFCVA